MQFCTSKRDGNHKSSYLNGFVLKTIMVFDMTCMHEILKEWKWNVIINSRNRWVTKRR